MQFNLPSIYAHSDRHKNALKLIQSPSLRSLRCVSSFRSAHVSTPKHGNQKRRKRSLSHISSFNTSTSSKRNHNRQIKSQRNVRSTKSLISYKNENTNPNIQNIPTTSPFDLITKPLSIEKEAWISSYFEDEKSFQSTFYFISLKFQELTHLTNKDQHPSSFRIAMACQLLITFIEKSKLFSFLFVYLFYVNL